MIVTRHERSEWSRMVQDCYSNDLNWLGHRMSGAASVPDAFDMRLDVFDTLQSLYRQWLLEGVSSFSPSVGR